MQSFWQLLTQSSAFALIVWLTQGLSCLTLLVGGTALKDFSS